MAAESITMLEERALVRRARRGDHVAFSDLFVLHRRAVYAHAMLIMADPEDAEDVTQEAFLAAWKSLETFAEKATFTTWLYTITSHCAQNVIDKRVRRAQLEQQATQAQHDQWDGPADIDTFLVQREQLQTLRRLITHLPAHYGGILSQHYMLEMSCEQIARELGLSVETVKTRIKRGREMLIHEFGAAENGRSVTKKKRGRPKKLRLI